ncbi:MAG TPA: helix-turn-helix domain-containing protein, partial [Chloroflexia bacterium]|nr:helix-turn-helix domain-containing protein [Chloroflexia bacterium]
MSDPKLFAQWLRDRRKALRLTQAELAARSGLSFSAVQKLEGGQRRPSQQVAESLVEALQIAPKERARFLRIAIGAAGSDGGDERETTPPTNLPAHLTPLIGREVVLDGVASLLRSDNVRLLTLTGPPGIGKTRLAIQTASHLLPEFQDGVFLVTLAPLRDPAGVIGNIAAALSVREKSTEP